MSPEEKLKRERALHVEAQRRYEATPKGKEARSRANISDKTRARNKRFNQTEKGRARNAKYERDPMRMIAQRLNRKSPPQRLMDVLYKQSTRKGRLIE